MSGAWSSGGVRLSRRASTAVDRTRGRGRAGSGGAGIPREHRPMRSCASGAQVSRARGRGVRIPEGSKASKRAERHRAGEPGSFGGLPRSACGATRTKDRWSEMTAARNSRHRSRVATHAPSRGCGPARGRRSEGNRSEIAGVSASEIAVATETAREHRAVESSKAARLFGRIKL